MEALEKESAKQVALAYRGMISHSLWERLVARVQKDNPLLSREWAEMIMDGALGFLKLCADFPHHHFAPSKMVDIGWHTFLMYTLEYQKFCQRVARRFIHHCPNDIPGKKGPTAKETVVFMSEVGMSYNLSIWGKSADCNDEDGGGCDTCNHDDSDDCDDGDDCGNCQD